MLATTSVGNGDYFSRTIVKEPGCAAGRTTPGLVNVHSGGADQHSKPNVNTIGDICVAQAKIRLVSRNRRRFPGTCVRCSDRWEKLLRDSDSTNFFCSIF